MEVIDADVVEPVVVVTVAQRVARRALMLADRAAGMSHGGLARKYRMSAVAVRKVLELEPRGSGLRGPKSDGGRADRIVSALRLGASYGALAKQYGVSRQRIYQIAAAAGYEGKRCGNSG